MKYEQADKEPELKPEQVLGAGWLLTSARAVKNEDRESFQRLLAHKPKPIYSLLLPFQPAALTSMRIPPYSGLCLHLK